MKAQDENLLNMYMRLIDYDSKCCKKQADDVTNNLTDCQNRYLKLIDENEPLTSGQFAKLCHVSKPTISQIVNRFVGEGYILKEVSSEDKRAYLLKTTEKGKRVARSEYYARIEVVEYIKTKLDEDEISQLITLMEKMLDFEEDL